MTGFSARFSTWMSAVSRTKKRRKGRMLPPRFRARMRKVTEVVKRADPARSRLRRVWVNVCGLSLQSIGPSLLSWYNRPQ